MPEIIIGDDTPIDHIDLNGGAKGCIPRDFAAQPLGSLMRNVVFPLIPRSEWSARIKQMETTQSRLSDIRMQGNNGAMIPSLDQGQWGYCWAHSTTNAETILRAKANMPYVPLSAFAIAATIKNGANEGGWGAQSMQFAQDRGIPSQKFWPQQSASLSHGTPECWADAAKHKITSGWVDLDQQQWDRSLTFDQVITLLLSRIPVVGDFNWWGHSVCLLDAVETSPGAFGVRIWNSWADSWGENGTGVLTGSKAIPDGATAPLVTNA